MKIPTNKEEALQLITSLPKLSLEQLPSKEAIARAFQIVEQETRKIWSRLRSF